MITPVMRNYFSTYFLATARYLNHLARMIEENHSAEPRFDLRHRGLVISSILNAASFLEANINELFQDAHDQHLPPDRYVTPLDPEIQKKMTQLWKVTDEGANLRPLDKYQMILVLNKHEVLDKGRQPFQDAALLIQLRNALAHYQPTDLSADSPHAMEKRLRGKFVDNQLMEGSRNPWWPDHALGLGCAEWAYSSAKNLADTVVTKLGIRPNYMSHERSGWLDSILAD